MSLFLKVPDLQDIHIERSVVEQVAHEFKHLVQKVVPVNKVCPKPQELSSHFPAPVTSHFWQLSAHLVQTPLTAV